jgi:hypothetical protein
VVRGRPVPVGWEGCRERIYRRVNIVQILCTHVCKWKLIPIETIPGMEERGIKEKDGRDEFNYDILDIL